MSSCHGRGRPAHSPIKLIGPWNPAKLKPRIVFVTGKSRGNALSTIALSPVAQKRCLEGPPLQFTAAAVQFLCDNLLFRQDGLIPNWTRLRSIDGREPSDGW